MYICNSVAFTELAKLSKYSPGADKVGITSAVICAVHCLVIPAVFVVKYALTDGVAGSLSEVWGTGLPDWWELLDYVFLAVGLFAVFHAATHAPARGIRIALWVFWLCLAIAVIFEEHLHWLAYIASAGLVTTHFFNIRMHRSGKTYLFRLPSTS